MTLADYCKSTTNGRHVPYSLHTCVYTFEHTDGPPTCSPRRSKRRTNGCTHIHLHTMFCMQLSTVFRHALSDTQKWNTFLFEFLDTTNYDRPTSFNPQIPTATPVPVVISFKRSRERKSCPNFRSVRIWCAHAILAIAPMMAYHIQRNRFSNISMCRNWMAIWFEPERESELPVGKSHCALLHNTRRRFASYCSLPGSGTFLPPGVKLDEISWHNRCLGVIPWNWALV